MKRERERGRGGGGRVLRKSEHTLTKVKFRGIEADLWEQIE